MTTLDERLTTMLGTPLAPDAGLLAGDHPGLAASSHQALTPAAVLIAVTDRAEPGVILTRRTETLRRHAGQIAFPGGRVDPGEDAIAAALREAHEEVAMPMDQVRVIGPADRYGTGTGYDITPVLAAVPPDLPLLPAEAEVAEVFEVPLAFVLDRANHGEDNGEWHGKVRQYYVIEWRGYRIWGATAAIIVNLSRRLRWS